MTPTFLSYLRLDKDVCNYYTHSLIVTKLLFPLTAEQRLKDRITASAREKLSQADREAQMKLERKRKAAMFINLLKSQNNAEKEAETNTGDYILCGVACKWILQGSHELG